MAVATKFADVQLFTGTGVIACRTGGGRVEVGDVRRIGDDLRECHARHLVEPVALHELRVRDPQVR